MGTRESEPGGATTPQATDAQTACQADSVRPHGAAEGASTGAGLVARLRDLAAKTDATSQDDGDRVPRRIAAQWRALVATFREAADAIDAIPGIKRLTRLAAMEECLAIARRSGGNIYVAIKRIEAAANGECAKGVKADG